MANCRAIILYKQVLQIQKEDKTACPWLCFVCNELTQKNDSVLLVTCDLLITNNNLEEFKCFNSERRDSNLGVRKLGSCLLSLICETPSSPCLSYWNRRTPNLSLWIWKTFVAMDILRFFLYLYLRNGSKEDLEIKLCC